MRDRAKWLRLSPVALGIVYLIPFYILITTSLKKESDLSSKWALPGYLDLDNFVQAWSNARLDSAFVNTLVVTGCALALLVLLGSLSAYPLARYPSRWNKLMYVCFVSALIVPPLAILVPLYKFYVDLGGINTYWGIVLLQTTFYLPMAIFLYTGFIKSIPKDLDEAAMIDGAGKIGLFLRILLPLLKPVTASVMILCGVQIWNDYQFSVFFLQKADMQTFTVALSVFIGQFNSNIGWVAAGSFIAAVPLAALYLFLQRYFINGLASGAVKG